MRDNARAGCISCLGEAFLNHLKWSPIQAPGQGVWWAWYRGIPQMIHTAASSVYGGFTSRVLPALCHLSRELERATPDKYD